MKRNDTSKSRSRSSLTEEIPKKSGKSTSNEKNRQSRSSSVEIPGSSKYLVLQKSTEFLQGIKEAGSGGSSKSRSIVDKTTALSSPRTERRQSSLSNEDYDRIEELKSFNISRLFRSSQDDTTHHRDRSRKAELSISEESCKQRRLLDLLPVHPIPETRPRITPLPSMYRKKSTIFKESDERTEIQNDQKRKSVGTSNSFESRKTNALDPFISQAKRWKSYILHPDESETLQKSESLTDSKPNVEGLKSKVDTPKSSVKPQKTSSEEKKLIQKRRKFSEPAAKPVELDNKTADAAKISLDPSMQLQINEAADWDKYILQSTDESSVSVMVPPPSNTVIQAVPEAKLSIWDILKAPPETPQPTAETPKETVAPPKPKVVPNIVVSKSKTIAPKFESEIGSGEEIPETTFIKSKSKSIIPPKHLSATILPKKSDLKVRTESKSFLESRKLSVQKSTTTLSTPIKKDEPRKSSLKPSKTADTFPRILPEAQSRRVSLQTPDQLEELAVSKDEPRKISLQPVKSKSIFEQTQVEETVIKKVDSEESQFEPIVQLKSEPSGVKLPMVSQTSIVSFLKKPTPSSTAQSKKSSPFKQSLKRVQAHLKYQSVNQMDDEDDLQPKISNKDYDKEHDQGKLMRILALLGKKKDNNTDALGQLSMFGIPDQKKLLHLLLPDDPHRFDFGGLMRQYYSYVLRSYALVNMQDRYRGASRFASCFANLDVSSIGSKEEEHEKVTQKKLISRDLAQESLRAVAVDDDHFKYLKSLENDQHSTIPITIVKGLMDESLPIVEDIYRTYAKMLGINHVTTKKAAEAYVRIKRRVEMYSIIETVKQL